MSDALAARQMKLGVPGRCLAERGRPGRAASACDDRRDRVRPWSGLVVAVAHERAACAALLAGRPDEAGGRAAGRACTARPSRMRWRERPIPQQAQAALKRGRFLHAAAGAERGRVVRAPPEQAHRGRSTAPPPHPPSQPPSCRAPPPPVDLSQTRCFRRRCGTPGPTPAAGTVAGRGRRRSAGSRGLLPSRSAICSANGAAGRRRPTWFFRRRTQTGDPDAGEAPTRRRRRATARAAARPDAGLADASTMPQSQVLIPAGRGVYAHPILALSSDQTQPCRHAGR